MKLEVRSLVRIKTGLLLGGGFLLLCLLASSVPTARWFLLVLGLLVVGASAWECAELSNRDRMLPRGINRVLYLFPALLPGLLISFWFLSKGGESCNEGIAWIALLSVTLVFISGAMSLILAGDISLDAASSVSRDVLLSAMLVGFGGASLLLMSMMGGGIGALVWMVGVVVGNDSAAYFAGSAVGGRRMAPHISPNKTVAGGLAGIVVGVLIGAAFSSSFLGISALGGALLGLVVVVAAQLADLAKSFIKRIHNAKDSGTLLPGHGGILDRCDGYFGAAPVVLLFLLWQMVITG